mgnify:CR=1 FL=1
MKTQAGTDMGAELRKPRPGIILAARPGDGSMMERRQGERRKGERRKGERRQGFVSYAIRGSAPATPTANRRIARRLVALTLVLAAVAAGAFSLYMQSLEAMRAMPKERKVIVSIKGVGSWEASPQTLATYFSTDKILTDIQKQARPIPPQIQNQMIARDAAALLQREDAFLKRVRGMPWDEFEKRATHVPVRKPRIPSIQERQSAMSLAIIK